MNTLEKPEKLGTKTLRHFTRSLLLASQFRQAKHTKKESLTSNIKKIERLSKGRIVDKEKFSKELNLLKEKVHEVIENENVIVEKYRKEKMTEEEFKKKLQDIQSLYLKEN